MRSVAVARRLSAIVALAAIVGVLAVVVVVLARHLLELLLAIACLSLAIGAAAYAVTRTGPRRLAAAVLALLAPIVLLVANGQLLSCCSCWRWRWLPGWRPAARSDATSTR